MMMNFRANLKTLKPKASKNADNECSEIIAIIFKFYFYSTPMENKTNDGRKQMILIKWLVG